MAKWTRDTPWRQGHLLTPEAIAAFGLNGNLPSDQVAAIVVSHDCDIAQTTDVEPHVEIIVGAYCEAVDGNLTNCKSARRLHLPCSRDGIECFINLSAKEKIQVLKESAQHPSLSESSPSKTTTVAAPGLNILQRWLALRYRRAAFPDEFDRRLGKKVTGTGEALERVFRKSGAHIAAVFFDVDHGEDRAHDGPDDPYELFITLVYSSDGPDSAEAEARACAEATREIFTKQCKGKTGAVTEWQWIELAGVDVISDRALTYADSLLLRKWQADHISMKEDPQGAMIEPA